MLVSKNQFYVFIACVAFGAVCGLIFGVLSIFKCFFKSKILKFFPDVISGILSGLIFILYTYLFNFPNLRVYMLVGFFLGLVGYFKSFNIILAKSAEKIYNVYKLKKVKRKHDRIKVQKISCRYNSRRGNVNDNLDIHNGVSVNFHRRRIQS